MPGLLDAPWLLSHRLVACVRFHNRSIDVLEPMMVFVDHTNLPVRKSICRFIRAHALKPGSTHTAERRALDGRSTPPTVIDTTPAALYRPVGGSPQTAFSASPARAT